MKRCPQCNRVETDDALAFCRADGTRLIADTEASVDLKFDPLRSNPRFQELLKKVGFSQ